MQFGHDFAQKCRIGGLHRDRDFFDEFRADVAVLIPHREMVQHGFIGSGLGNVHIIGHAAPRRFVTGLCLARSERIALSKWQRSRTRVVHYPIGNAKRNDKGTDDVFLRREKMS
jgi:hypothetical protein